jgi:type I restriction enzyme, S subunit
MIHRNFVKISEFCETGSGTTPSRQKLDRYYGGKIPWVKSGELRESKILATEEHVTKEALAETSLRLVPAGALLVAMYGATVGRVGQLGIQATTNQAVCHIVPDQSIADAGYMFHALCAKASELVAKGVGGAQPNISQGTIKDTEVYLPPLDDQKRIAAILDQADALRTKRKQALTRLNQLAQAIFYEMFGDPVAPDSNVAVRLADIAELINGDRSSNYPSGDDIKDSGVLFLNTTNIKNGELDLSRSQYIAPQKFASLSRGKLSRGDLVITLRGTLGQCALFHCAHDTGFINAQMMIIRCHQAAIPRYLKEYISFPSIQGRLNNANTGSAVPQLTATQMKEMQIILPSIDDQHRFVQAVDSARSVQAVQVEHQAHLEGLFTSLQHRAFRGEL